MTMQEILSKYRPLITCFLISINVSSVQGCAYNDSSLVLIVFVYFSYEIYYFLSLLVMDVLILSCLRLSLGMQFKYIYNLCQYYKQDNFLTKYENITVLYGFYGAYFYLFGVLYTQQQSQSVKNQKQMNELSYGEKIKIPSSVVRSVSFEKIKQGALSARTSKIAQDLKKQEHVQPSELCERLMNKKLLGNEVQMQRNPLQNKSIHNNLAAKVQMMKKQLQQKQMKECTFKPKVNKSTQPQRTLQQFIGHQIAYEKNKEDKVNQMRQMIRAKIEKQNTFQPTLINNNEYSNKRTSGEVHERLYEQYTKRGQSKESVPQSLQKRSNLKFATQRKIATYSRKGSEKSQKSVNESHQASKKSFLPHNDPSQFNSSVPNPSETSKQITQSQDHYESLSSRNQHSRAYSNRSSSQKGLKVTKYMDVQQVCERKLNNKKIIQERQSKKTSTRNKQIFIKKVLREISLALTEMNISHLDLSYMQMSQILQKMNFIDEKININDRKYLFEIWQMLQGDVYESVPLANLIKIIFCLLGCHDFNIIQECLALVMEETPSSKRLILTQKQSKSIKANFEQLALNRLRKGQYISKQPKSQQFSFKPFVSKSSAEMAQKYRQKVIQESQQLLNNNLIQFDIGESGQVDHVNLLLLDDKRKELKMKIKRQEQERERKRIQDESMQGQKYKKSKPKLFQSQQSISARFEHLYELGKQQIRHKNEKYPEMQQIPKQCTFQPNVYKSKQNPSSYRFSSKQNSMYNSNNPHQPSSRPVEQIKDFDKSIFRMYQGRKVRQTTKISPNISRSSQQHFSKDDDSPFLYLNINMAGYDDVKVPVFQTDSMKTITHKVKVLMGLQQAQDNKLEQILRIQIIPTLKQIGMDLDLQ